MEEYKENTEYPIGTVLSHKKEVLVVTLDPNYSCYNCAFEGREKCINQFCTNYSRQDNRDIIYLRTLLKLEEVEETNLILFRDQIEVIYNKAEQYLIDLINNNGGEYILSLNNLPKYSNEDIDSIEIQYWLDLADVKSLVLSDNKVTAKANYKMILLDNKMRLHIADAIIKFNL